MSYFKAKCIKFDFGSGSAPKPTWGVYSAPTDPLDECKGPTPKGKGMEGKSKRGEGKGREKRGGDHTTSSTQPV